MPTVRKVALVSHGGTSYVHRMMLGALSHLKANVITRDFRLHEDCKTHADHNEAELRQLRSWNPDGLLCALGSECAEKLIQSLARPRPVVNMFAAKPMPGMTLAMASLSAMFTLSVEHLRQQGLKAPVYLDLEDPQLHPGRSQSFIKIARPATAAAASFLEVVRPDLLADPSARVTPVPARLVAWIRQLPKPAGVICTTNGGGGYLIRVCHELGLRVPEDVAVLGTDDTDLALASTPTLTTVMADLQQIGRAAMHQLVELLDGTPAPSEPVRIKAMDLHVRESTGLKRPQICDIAAAMEYISQHACHGITVHQMIRETQRVSTKTFYTHFQAITGQTPAEAILQRQIKEAQRLLATTKISITEVAEYCGFSSSSNFARTFRSVRKTSPKDYRKQSQMRRSPAK